MYLPHQENGTTPHPPHSDLSAESAVMDPLRFPVQNGEVNNSKTDEQQQFSQKNRLNENAGLSMRSQAPVVPSKAIESCRSPQTSRPMTAPSFIPLKPSSTSSTHPTNITVQNISSSVSNKVNRKPQQSQRIKDKAALGDPYNSVVQNKIEQTNSRSLQANIENFATSLTSALLESRELEEVDLKNKQKKELNDSTFRNSTPSNPNLPMKKNVIRNIPLRTPANSIDQSGFSNLQTIKGINSHNISSPNFSLPVSQVYEPEPVDFPSSPGEMRTSQCGMRLAEDDDTTPKAQDYDSGCLYTAVALPPSGLVSMKKTPQQPRKASTSQQKQIQPPDSRKRLTVSDDMFNSANDDDQPSIASLDDDDDEDDDAQMLSNVDINEMLTPDDINTPDELEESIMEQLGAEENQCSSEGHSPRVLSLSLDNQSFRSVIIQGIERRIDMQVIEPYKKVLSHGGHLVSGEAIIVFSACYLPDRARHDYDYVMDHLFMYVLTALDQLIAEDYVLVYLHGATTRANMPSFNWLKRCYQMIDRRLRKNLQVLYLVHPTFWVKTVVVMIRPFVSAKFSRKLRFVTSLQDLADLIPMEQVCIPARIKQYDEIRENILKKNEQLTTK